MKKSGSTERRAVIYCRVSTKDQVSNLSLDTQEQNCRRFCDEAGIVVDRVFRELGESAKTKNRTELIEALHHCARNRGRVGFFIVHDLTRFARNILDHQQVRAALEAHGVALRSVKEQIDESSSGRLIETIHAGFSQYDNDLRRDKTVTGMQERIQRRGWPFMAPVGYLKQNGGLAQDPKVAPLVRKAFELVGAGRTPTEARTIVTTLGLRTRAGNRISSQTFSDMLRNERYAGWLGVSQWNQRVRGDFEPIVSAQLFDQVQTALAAAGGHKAQMRVHPVFPLRGLVRCNCGRPLTGSSPRGRNGHFSYYHCTKCRKMNIRKELLELEFLSLLHSLVPSAAVWDEFEEALRRAWRRATTDSRERQQQLTADMESLLSRRQRVIDLLIDGKLDAGTAKEQKERIDGALHEAEHALAGVRMTAGNPEALTAFARAFFRNLPAVWNRLEVAEKRQLTGYLFPDGLDLAGKTLGTKASASPFNDLLHLGERNEGLVDLTGIEPVTS